MICCSFLVSMFCFNSLQPEQRHIAMETPIDNTVRLNSIVTLFFSSNFNFSFEHQVSRPVLLNMLKSCQQVNIFFVAQIDESSRETLKIRQKRMGLILISSQRILIRGMRNWEFPMEKKFLLNRTIRSHIIGPFGSAAWFIGHGWTTSLSSKRWHSLSTHH